jgi:hypothetical protein
MKAYTQPTIWAVPDAAWTLIKQVLNAVNPAKSKGARGSIWAGCSRASSSAGAPAANGISCPKRFGDDSTVPRDFQRWAVLVQARDDLGGVDWQGPAAAAALDQAHTGSDLVGREPTGREPKGESAASYRHGGLLACSRPGPPTTRSVTRFRAGFGRRAATSLGSSHAEHRGQYGAVPHGTASPGADRRHSDLASAPGDSNRQ